MRLSVIIPIYNEAGTLEEILRRVLEAGVYEIIAVDDASTDRSLEILEAAAAREPRIRVVRHEQNAGKGAAIRSALPHVKGDAVLIQDADLEYDPADYAALIEPMEKEGAPVVYGSRILGGSRASYRRFYWGGRLLSLATTLLFGKKITDQHTCYKMFRTDVIRSLPLRENGFGFCAEVTALLLKRGVEIREVPISYAPRRIEQGKKIRWRDGIEALWICIKHRFGN